MTTLITKRADMCVRLTRDAARAVTTLTIAVLGSQAASAQDTWRINPRRPTAVDAAIMKAMTADYRTSLGGIVEGAPRPDSSAFDALGLKAAPDGTLEAFIVQPYEDSKFIGNLGLTRRGDGVGGGPIKLERLQTGALVGALLRDGKSVGYAACPVQEGQMPDARPSGASYWVSLGPRKREADGRYVVQVTLQNVYPANETVGIDDLLVVKGSSGEVLSGPARNPADGRNFRGGELNLRPCQQVTVSYTFDTVPAQPQQLLFTSLGRRDANWDVASDFSSRPPQAEPSPRPSPQPTPPSQPAPAPQPAPEPAPVPAGAFSFASYGPWEFKVDELVRGPDGHFQAVVTVRNASDKRLGFTITDLDVSLIDANGRSIRRLGNLHHVEPAGPAASLQRNPATNYLEPGDQLRGRLLFPGSAGLKPVQIRLKEPVRTGITQTFPLR